MEEWYQTDDFFICVREQDQAEDDVPVYFAFPKHPEEFWPQNADLERKVAVADGAPTGGGGGETKGSSPFGAAYSPGGGTGMGGGGQYSPQQQQQQQQQYSPQQHPSQPDVDGLEESYTATEGGGDPEEKPVSEMTGAERVAAEKARRKKKKQEAAAAAAAATADNDNDDIDDNDDDDEGDEDADGGENAWEGTATATLQASTAVVTRGRRGSMADMDTDDMDRGRAGTVDGHLASSEDLATHHVPETLDPPGPYHESLPKRIKAYQVILDISKEGLGIVMKPTITGCELAIVRRFSPQSAAEKSGAITPGDALLAVNGQNVTKMEFKDQVGTRGGAGGAGGDYIGGGGGGESEEKDGPCHCA
jgi:hypothetical protein